MSEVVTPNLRLPLPHETLNKDRPRIAQSLLMIDVAVTAANNATAGLQAQVDQMRLRDLYQLYI
ncbi:hypothetical protein F6R98_10755 [Candidatus Methylospira mobilis]|uniref:Uncharacterized protein n=1 Tax=Candidatus Methylospira mobilis TaxID=1808979 RepID=A0A5Q0BLQ7_9GAMM|nr:hypothetical protein [Candidatus Methylospira mobilis]QFY43037.1 hypothetical protein F6R98_10755 [Candidatus Methylospira mobilis]